MNTARLKGASLLGILSAFCLSSNFAVSGIRVTAVFSCTNVTGGISILKAAGAPPMQLLNGAGGDKSSQFKCVNEKSFQVSTQEPVVAPKPPISTQTSCPDGTINTSGSTDRFICKPCLDWQLPDGSKTNCVSRCQTVKVGRLVSVKSATPVFSDQSKI